jgi:hypothetical protein
MDVLDLFTLLCISLGLPKFFMLHHTYQIKKSTSVHEALTIDHAMEITHTVVVIYIPHATVTRKFLTKMPDNIL